MPMQKTSLLASVAIVVLVSCVYGRTIKLNESNGLTLKSSRDEQTSVARFGRLVLCAHMGGQSFFFKAIKEKTCKLKDEFVMTLVTELCARRGPLLEKWVSEVFDINGDGYITSMEVDTHVPAV